VIHLYAVTAELPPAVDVRGIDGADLSTVDAGALLAVASEHATAPTADAANALAHATVIAAVGDQVPSLPVRFGAHHRDHAAVRAALAETEDLLLATLARVGHAVEYVVRTEPTPATGAPVSTPTGGGDEGRGRRYLEERLAEQRAATAAADAVRERVAVATAALEALAIEVTERLGRSGPERCFLVDRSTHETFETAAAAATADSDLVLGGPWPPFTFAAEVTR
jgi:hypothetical protein